MLRKIINSLFGWGKSSQQTELAKGKDGGVRHKLKRMYQSKVALQMRNLEAAIASAENPMQPSRITLYAIYKEIARDGQLLSQMRTTRNKLRAAAFLLVDAKGVEQKEAVKLLEKPWFSRYVSMWSDTQFWGHSLLEFDIDSDGSFLDVELVPREHVHPWSGEVVINTTDTKGLPYREPPFTQTLVEIGHSDDLGLLLIAAKEVIWKNYSRTDWSRYSEKFGMPLLAIKASQRDEKELDALEEMAANFGSNGYVILDDEDDIQFVETSKTDAYQVYKEMCQYCDSQISKIISGQTGTSDEKSFVGSAEVHERIMEDYLLALLRDLQDDVNYKLLPWAAQYQPKLAGLTIKYKDLLPLPPPAPAPPVAVEKKKLSKASLIEILSPCGHGRQMQLARPIADVDKLMQIALERVYKQRLDEGLEADTWRANVENLWQAANEGTNQNLLEIDFDSQDADLLVALRRNVYSFAAFKNHSMIEDMITGMHDENGKLRTFEEFAKEAQPTWQTYNMHWLNTEYNAALGSAAMAVKWNDIESRKGIFPLLRYKAVGDERTREGHAKLNDVCLPVEHEFWQTYYPLNGWNCRCTVEQVASGEIVEPDDMPTEKEVPSGFRFNPGSTGQLFGDDHPYFDVAPKAKAEISLAMRRLILKDEPTFEESLNIVKKSAKLKEVTSPVQMSMPEAAALHYYTTRNFQLLNLRLRTSRRKDADWATEGLINSGLERLPKYKGEVIRVDCTNMKPDFLDDIQKAFADGTPYIDKGFLSSSYDTEYAQSIFKKGALAQHRIIYIIQSKTGRNIEAFSKKGTIFGKENQAEVLFKSGTKFTIESIDTSNPNFIKIKMKE